MATYIARVLAGGCTASSTKLRVIHLVPSVSREGGGVSEVVRLLVASLAERMPGQVEIVSLEDAGTARDLPSWPAVPITLHRWRLSHRFRPSLSLLRGLLRQRADVLHVHAVWSFHTFVAWVWQRRTGGAVIITPHGMFEPWIMSRSRAIKKLLRRSYLDGLVRKTSFVHVLTEKEGGDVHLLYPAAELKVIPNFVALPARDVNPGIPAWWHNTMAAKDIFLFLGRMHEKKGCRELLAAWVAVCTSDPSFAMRSQLVFCGWDDGLIGFANEIAVAAKAHGNVLHAGPVYGDEKERTLAAATFCVLPSKSEGLPMTVLEAWASGVAVIMTRQCNLPIGFEREAAIECDATRTGIAAALTDASRTTPEMRTRLARNGRALVEERYSSKSVTTAMINLYRLAVGEVKS